MRKMTFASDKNVSCSRKLKNALKAFHWQSHPFLPLVWATYTVSCEKNGKCGKGLKIEKNREKTWNKNVNSEFGFRAATHGFFVLNECYIHPFLCWKKKSIPFNWRWIETGKLHHISWRAHQICATFWNELSWMIFFSFYSHIPIFAKIPIFFSFGDKI